ncbi:hypothetical protein BI308_18020 [Roseofilum reptotaenium AO1-A]|uniref:Uncharacterized protein n=1 Tax=Roseofilum reptotaenium AO1-A TaxID=1925591 RepID=A0A1L9QNC0_9CYAN|nr:hypothetical protein BI308_18020 [Roseofilum reptotaenium AO1-A]
MTKPKNWKRLSPRVWRIDTLVAGINFLIGEESSLNIPLYSPHSLPLRLLKDNGQGICSET